MQIWKALDAVPTRVSVMMQLEIYATNKPTHNIAYLALFIEILRKLNLQAMTD